MDSTIKGPGIQPAKVYSLIDRIKGKSNSCGALDWNLQGLQFQYNERLDLIAAREPSGLLLTRSDFEELVVEMRRFFDEMGDGCIDEHNAHQIAIDNEPPAYIPPPRYLPRIKGHVYLLGGEAGVYKIGKAQNVDKRVLQIQPAMPFKPWLIHSIECEDYTNAEALLHEQFADKRVNGEWFRLTDADVDYIKTLISISAEVLFNE